jgi:hypothetical protein
MDEKSVWIISQSDTTHLVERLKIGKLSIFDRMKKKTDKLSRLHTIFVNNTPLDNMCRRPLPLISSPLYISRPWDPVRCQLFFSFFVPSTDFYVAKTIYIQQILARNPVAYLTSSTFGCPSRELAVESAIITSDSTKTRNENFYCGKDRKEKIDPKIFHEDQRNEKLPKAKLKQ